MLKKLDRFHWAVALSTLSLSVGLVREFLIIGLLGFSAQNDALQIYLSIFYTIGLSIDAMRLACLNLCTYLSLCQLLMRASCIALPFSLLVGIALAYSTGNTQFTLWLIAVFGSYLNLLAALLITYKQRANRFLPAQIINLLPNFILIPGILICYWYGQHLIFSIVALTSFIPVMQCLCLLLLSGRITVEDNAAISFSASLVTFARHFAAMFNEQFFQVILRSAFYRYGTGFLSLYAMAVRIYSAARFILVDSFIGSKLAIWQDQEKDYLASLHNLTLLSLLFVVLAFTISLSITTNLLFVGIQMSALFLFGFYFSTLVRVTYFKINRHENNGRLIWQFAGYELVCVLLALYITQLNYPILLLLWLGYIAKPFAQLFLLRKHYRCMAFNNAA